MSSMNDNAKLYVQNLFYWANIGPYQCLTLPWWVHTPQPTYYPRHGCEIKPLICGEKVFGKIASDLRNAKHSVDIITWGFDPGMVLERTGATAEIGTRYGDLLKEISARKDHPVKIRLLVWHDDPLSQSRMKNIPGYYGTRFPSIGCSEMGYYSESHQNYNADWFEKVCTEALPNISFHVRNIPSALRFISLKNESTPSGFDEKISELYASHHQKMILIDYEKPADAIGYVMGHNSITDFWDTEAHKFRDKKRERFYKKDPAKAWKEGPALDPDGGLYAPGYPPSEYELKEKERAVQAYLDRNSYITKPYQDVSCRLRGPILCDLNHNFCEAWQESELPSSFFMDCYWLIPSIIRKTHKAIRNILHSGMDTEFIEQRKKISRNPFDFLNGQHSVQLLRTQPKHKEKTIKECYANLTRQIHHYIFIQNQYIQYEPWARHIKECVQRLRSAGYAKPIYVFMLTSTPESNRMDLPTYDVASKIGQSHTMVVEHAKAKEEAERAKAKMPLSPEEMEEQGIKAIMGSLWTCADNPRTAEDYEEIYIHSKVAIVDDAAFTLGSANLNLRSMALDSELNVLSQAQDVAYELRTDLFHQCTKDVGPAQFGDMSHTFNEWVKHMKKNKNLRKSLKPLSNQLLAFHVDRKPGSPII